MARLREGRANTARGAAHFLRETVGRVRYAGASGQLTLRADSGFYTHSVVSACRRMDVRFSITIRQHKSLHNLIEAIPEDAWTPIPYWMDGAADVAETTCTPFQSEPDAAPVRLIVRRVKPAPGSQLALFATYSYHGFITDRDGETLELEADHRRHAEIENAIRDLKYGVGPNHLPSGRFAANAASLDSAQECEGGDMSVQEGLGGLGRVGLDEAAVAVGQVDDEAVGLLLNAADDHQGLAEVALGVARRMGQRHEHLLGLTAVLSDVVLDRGVSAVESVFVPEAHRRCAWRCGAAS